MTPLYNILSLQKSDTGFEAIIGLDAEHIIYKAHFPGNPITPGVILLQICKQCAIDILRQQGKLSTYNPMISDIKMLKFINFIVPQADKTVTISIQQTDNTFKTVIFDSEKEYAKMQFTISI